MLKATIPPGSRFKGYETYLVQDLVLSVHAIRYRRERWVTPAGQTIVAPLPEGTRGHFGPNLRRCVLMQYHQGQTTLPRLTALLQSIGVSISKREIQRLLTEKAFLQKTATCCVRDCKRHLGSRLTIRLPGIKPGTGFARRSATTALPGLAHDHQRPG